MSRFRKLFSVPRLATVSLLFPWQPGASTMRRRPSSPAITCRLKISLIGICTKSQLPPCHQAKPPRLLTVSLFSGRKRFTVIFQRATLSALAYLFDGLQLFSSAPLSHWTGRLGSPKRKPPPKHGRKLSCLP